MAERSAVNRNVEGSSPSAGARSGGAMPSPNPGYSITVRVQAPAASGMIGNVTSNAADAEHVDVITEAIGELDGFVVRKVSDRTFLMHLGGKLEVNPKVPLRHRDDLSRAYTP